MRNHYKDIGLCLAVAASLALAGCQGGGMAGAAGGPMIAATPTTSTSSATTANTWSARAATNAPKQTSTRGLKSYKVYNTTESLCAQTCKSEGRCKSHKFSPIQKINGYVAGQCQFFGT